MTIGILVMAAGFGTRFNQLSIGENKLMALSPGLTNQSLSVLAHTLNNARNSGLEVVVVTRPEYLAVQQQAEELACRWIGINSQGLGESIAAGVRQTADWQGWLIALADMPFITGQTYNAVASALNTDDVVYPSYQGQQGHPVGFGVNYRSGLMALTGDNGARALLREASAKIVSVKDPGIVWDIDKPSHLLGPFFQS